MRRDRDEMMRLKNFEGKYPKICYSFQNRCVLLEFSRQKAHEVGIISGL
jgi:hypothetical protein